MHFADCDELWHAGDSRRSELEAGQARLRAVAANRSVAMIPDELLGKNSRGVWRAENVGARGVAATRGIELIP